MKLLFSTTEDVRKHVSWIYASTDFQALEPDLLLATEDLMNIVNKDVYKRASEAYPVADDTEDLNKNLILLMQYPIALMAVQSFFENSDLSHEADGRKVKINKESETLPWEWMIERDNAAMLKKANRGIDRLIAFLDENIDSIQEWKDSEQCKDLKSLFIPNAMSLDNIVSIDRSRSFFLRILPLIRKEDRRLKSLLGSRYDDIKNRMYNDNLSDDEKSLIDSAREIVAYRSMSQALKVLSVKLLPDSIVQRFSSETQTQAATQPASLSSISIVDDYYVAEARRSEGILTTIVQRLNGVVDPYQAVDYEKEKYFRV